MFEHRGPKILRGTKIVRALLTLTIILTVTPSGILSKSDKAYVKGNQGQKPFLSALKTIMYFPFSISIGEKSHDV